MSLTAFIKKIRADAAVDFNETLQIIDAHYYYQPGAFSNGCYQDILHNEAGSNEGSCKIFAFAQLHHLNKAQTLQLFGDYYRLDVLNNPLGSGHQNIRNFMKYGWDGILFSDTVLTKK